jgi:hypothetical protein
MLRAPMSRMDILTPAEINAINSNSVMVQKYSQVIDRDSAYEILGRKVTDIRKAESEEAARKEWEKERTGGTVKPVRSSYGRSRSPQDQVVKVLTSATFIRGVFGILSKVMK